MARWSHADLTQLASAPPCGSGLTDFVRPVGCVGADRTSRVFYTGQGDQHIHQLRRGGDTWLHTDLSLLTGTGTVQAATSPMACLRPDSTLSVVYTARGGHIHLLQVAGEAVAHVDLSDVTGAPLAGFIGPPAHVVRGDGVAAIVYGDNAGENARVHQLALLGGTWVHADLTALTQSPLHSLIKVTAYVRADRTTAVIYVRGGLRELALPPGGQWTKADLLSPSTPPPHSLRWPMGFVRADGISAVLYADTGDFLHELAFVAGRWVATAVSEAAQAPRLTAGGGPMGYVRGDGLTAVVYAGADRHMHELTLVDGRWRHADLSQAAQTDTFGYPFAYVRGDGVSSVVYTGQDTHVHELARAPD
jgi:hypothetical protein